MIALGHHLVEELGVQAGCDTLAKWMAHYLAEIMLQVEQETDPSKKLVLQDRCCKVIERLWVNRNQLPGGAKPLGRVEDTLKALKAMKAELFEFPMRVSQAADESKNPWLTFACDSYAVDRRMASIALLNVLIETEFSKEKRWIDQHKEHLSKNEHELIRMLDGWLQSSSDRFFGNKPTSLASLSTEERNKVILKELDRSLKTQYDAYRKLKSRIKSNTGKQSHKTKASKVKRRKPKVSD